MQDFAEESKKARTEALLDMIPFLKTETTEFKKIFIDQWLKIFDVDSIRNELGTISDDFYNMVSNSLGEAAREGVLSSEDADKIVDNILITLGESFDLTEEELAFLDGLFVEELKNRFTILAEEVAEAMVSIAGLLTSYADLEKSTSKLKDAKQKLVNEEKLETEEVLALVEEYGSLIEYLDLTADNAGITAEALDEASDILVQAEIETARAKLEGVTATLKAAEANSEQILSLYALAAAQRETIPYSLASMALQAKAAKDNIASLKQQQRNIRTFIAELMNYTLEVERSTEAQDSWTASIKKSALEFKNMNELLETSNEELTNLRNEIKSLEEDMKDADLGTISTLEAHMEAYDKLRGVLEGQLNLQDNLKEEALEGLTQVLGILEEDIPGIDINDIIVDGKVDDTKFNNLVNFAKEQVNKLNEELALGRGTKATENQVKIYHTLINEVESYKDAIEKSDIAIDKVNDNLEDTRKKQQEYYESILINTLTYIEDALKQKFEKAFEDIQEAHDKSVEAIEDERDLWDEILEKQKERLNIEKELRESEKERRDLLKDIGEKQAEINKLSLDDSLFAKKRIKDLTGLVEKDKAKLEDIEYDTTFDARIAALDQLDAVKQKDFEKRLGGLETYLQSQEIRFETLLQEGNLERMAAALLRGAKFKVIGDEVIELNGLITELGEELEKTGTRKQLEGFNTFKEELELTKDILAEIGMTYETVIIDWSQIDSKNLKDFEADIISAADLVGSSFSSNILDEFKVGTSSLVNEIGLKAEEMTIKIGDHANSVVKIYRDMIVDINKAVAALGEELEEIPDKVGAIPSIFDRLYAMADEETRQLLLEAGVINIEAKEVILSTEKRFPEDKFTDYPTPGGPIIMPPKDSSNGLTPDEIKALEALYGSANGNFVEQDGLTFVHGESSPEWIFNSSQLESVIEMTNMNMIKSLASLKLKAPIDSSEVIIKNLINIEGNATEQTVIEIKKLAKQIAPYIDKRVVNNIKKR
ncbi:MAG: hypothetical protein KQ78_01862 [Candidatus Izimaplasma bacterium HR2]|nr:MAG: hypothetical protein KQ78_01862 [Candidatus Izimaplasma bacterium HR2]